MRRGISFTVSAGDGQRLRAIVADPKSPQKHVRRARIVLLSGAGLGTSAIMGETVNGGAKLVHPGGAKLVHLTLCVTRCWGVVPVVHRRDPRCLE